MGHEIERARTGQDRPERKEEKRREEGRRKIDRFVFRMNFHHTLVMKKTTRLGKLIPTVSKEL